MFPNISELMYLNEFYTLLLNYVYKIYFKRWINYELCGFF